MKTNMWIALLTIAIAVVGCSDNAIESAKLSVAKSLKDPQSAQFQNMTHFSEGVVCGDVNAKNAMGGYVGFKPFIFNGAQSGGVDLKPEPIDITDLCSNKQMKSITVMERRLKFTQRSIAEGKQKLAEVAGYCNRVPKPENCEMIEVSIAGLERIEVIEQAEIARVKAVYANH